jgi:hypothetical protein
MKELQIITCQPNDYYFNWQLRVQLHNLRKYGLSDKYTALIWYHKDRKGGEDFQTHWDALQKDYPEAKFVFYRDDTGELLKLIRMFNYIPLLRPWLLNRYFKDEPLMSQKAILYMDSDVVFTKKPNFDHLLSDDICYLSDTKSYISAEYFDSKVKDVLPAKLDNYKKVDVLDDLLRQFGLSRRIAVENQDGSGGAQYLLKNIDAQFWQDVFEGCITVKMNLAGVNKTFFESEDKGFQSWCGDMWSILFNLWRRGSKTACPPEMDFCWATDPIEKWDKVQIYHDAGAHTREIRPGHRLFLKREHKYINNLSTPFEDDLSFVSEEYCSKNYVQEMIEIKAEIWAESQIQRARELNKERWDQEFKDFILKG